RRCHRAGRRGSFGARAALVLTKINGPEGKHMKKHLLGTFILALAGMTAFAAPKPATLLNVSYDPTRELYQEIDAAFAAQWQRDTGQPVTIKQSHGGS